jgi:ketosteroid isomerase-like protein
MLYRSPIFLFVPILLVTLFSVPALADTPEQTVAAYHQALLNGGADAARELLADDLLLFEDGVPETSLEHYAGGHLKADVAFSKGAVKKLDIQRSWIEEDTATVASVYDVKTKYKGKRYHLKSTETMTLKLVDGRWVIVHIHWSNKQVK